MTRNSDLEKNSHAAYADLESPGDQNLHLQHLTPIENVPYVVKSQFAKEMMAEFLATFVTMLFGLKDFIATKAECLLHEGLDAVIPHELHQVTKLLLTAKGDATDDASLAKEENRKVSHIFLLRRRQKADHYDDSANCDRFDTLCDRSRAAVFEHEINSTGISDLVGHRRPVGVGLVVDDMVCAELLDKLEPLTGGRSDDSGGSSSLGNLESNDGHTSRTCNQNTLMIV
ncbi:hypothetical protein PC119_g4564 [Phytophthora cactorum]|nr:hypothetical protein PC119_g4564 [Phytophthora cactorum]KAG3185672.1 hypothetical protein C6341_g4327 [Phytophthora cactorum]